MGDTYTNTIIEANYIWFYNVNKLYLLIVKSFIHIKNISGTTFLKGVLVYRQNSHTRLVLQNTVMRNLEICDLNSYTHDLIIHTFRIDLIPSHCEGTDEGRIFLLERLGFVPIWLLVL